MNAVGWFLVQAENVSDPSTIRSAWNLNQDGLVLTFARAKDGEVVLHFQPLDTGPYPEATLANIDFRPRIVP